MTNPRETLTNASDSAPGVDDGPAGVRAPPVNSKPGGRGAVWIGVIVVLAIVVAAFFMRPLRTSDQPVNHGATQAQIDASRVPGTADRQEANQPVTQKAPG